MRRIILKVCLLFLLTFVLGSCQLPHSHSNKYTRQWLYGQREEPAHHLIKLIKIGMSKSEVQSLLGEPDKQGAFKAMSYWQYDWTSSELVSTVDGNVTSYKIKDVPQRLYLNFIENRLKDIDCSLYKK